MRRLVEIPLELDAAGAVVYPDPPELIEQPARVVGQTEDGADITEPVAPVLESNWGETWLNDTSIIGWYSGDLELPAYTGADYPPPHYGAPFRTSDVAPLFPADEWVALLTYSGTDPLVQALSLLVQSRNGWWEPGSSRYQATLDALVSEGVASAATAERFRYGLPR